MYGIKIKQVIFIFIGRPSSQVYPIKELVIKMKLCILLCLLTLAVSGNLYKLEHKGRKNSLRVYVLERLTSLSTNVNLIKYKQAQIGTELANWKTIVDNQFSSLKKQSKCKILRYMIMGPILVV